MANISNINNFFVVNTAQKRAAIGADLANNNGTPYVGVDFTVVGANSSSPVANLWLSNFTHKSYVLISDNSSNFIIRDPAASSNRLTIASGGNATFAAKVFSTSTVSGDIGTTLVTKDYVDSGDGSSINTILITVVNTGYSNVYFLDGVQQANAVLQPGFTYIFDQSNSSNSSHPLRFSSDSANSSPYTTGVTAVGTPGSSGAYTQIITTQATPVTLYYYCTSHAGMGGAATIRIIKTDSNAIFPGELEMPSYIRHTGDTNTYIGFSANDTIDLATASNVVLRIDSLGNSTFAGNVGIGLTPVTGWGASSEVIQLGDGVSDYGALAWNTISGADHFDLMYQSYFDGTNYKYGTNSAAVTAIRQRNGEIFLSTKSGGTANATFTWDDSLKIDNSGNTTITTTSNQGGLTVTSATDNTVVGINNTATGGQAWRLQSTGGSSGLGAGKLFLKVGGTEAAGNLISFITDGSGANIKMGIGLTSPGAKLDVLQEARVSFANSNQYTLRITNTDGNPRILADGSAAHLIFGTTPSGSATATERMRIQNDGNVAIGSTTANKLFNLADPAQGGEALKLHFEASSAVDKWGIYAYDRTNGHYANMSLGENAINILGSNKNVGIGTDSPSTPLMVNRALNSNEPGIYYDVTGGGSGSVGIGSTAAFGPFIVGNTLPNGNVRGAYSASRMLFNGGGFAFQTSDETSGTRTFDDKVKILINGNVGIGTTSPAAKLHVSGTSTQLMLETPNTTNDIDFRFRENGTNKWNIRYQNSTNDLQFLNQTGTAFIQLELSANGNVGIGTDSPASSYGFSKTLEIQGAANAEVNISQSNNSKDWSLGIVNGSNYQQTTSGQDYVWISGGTERMRITSGGNVYVGTSSPAYSSAKIVSEFNGVINNGILVSDTSSTGVQNMLVFAKNGSEVGTITSSTSATNYNTSSDYRLKENVEKMTGALDRVSQLKPSRFNFIADADKTVDGFLAHEVQQIVPEAITGEKDAVDEEGNPKHQGIDQSKLVPLLVGAIQELKAEIEILKNK